eukprot:Skav215835  [mRNA]  locus=scaffold4670:50114:55924:- [translate_table: standard]
MAKACGLKGVKVGSVAELEQALVVGEWLAVELVKLGETIEKMRNNRVPYLEAREAAELEDREVKVVRTTQRGVKEQIGAEIREAVAGSEIRCGGQRATVVS